VQRPDGSRYKRGKGTPQGGPLSPLLANIYLDPLDKELREQWRSSIEGWWNYFQLAERRREVEDQTGWIRRHMRKCFWLRWSRPKGRLNALRRLGVGPRARGLAYGGLGAWRMARLWQMNQALSNQRLHQHGFILPWTLTKAAT
jgi:hypothetical protein